MTNKLLKRLNNEIIAWENLYGDFYTMLYNSDGSIKSTKNEFEQEQMFKSLRECQAVMETLKKIKRNRFKEIKRPQKRKYKIWRGLV